MFDTEEAGQQAAAHETGDAPLAQAQESGGTPAHEGSAKALKGLALFAMPALIAGCGGGGGGGGAGGGIFPGAGGGANPQPDPATPADTGPYHYLQAKSDAEAARFLLQAQFSASEPEIAAVRSLGYLPWLEQQFNAPRTQTAWEWVESQPYNATDIDATVWRQLMLSGDAVRKRMALALSEIFVVSANDIGSSWPTHMMAQYWDMLAAGSSGNFRQLLEAVTLNPAMGFYLNTRGNQKENNRGRQPDENYAREVMQLMSIGLQQLEADGTPKTGADGQPLDSYTQNDVTQLARVFTGYDLDIKPGEENGFRPPGASYTVETRDWTTRPMVLLASRHSMLEAKFLGTTVPANTPGAAALKIALDTLFNHPNVGPFIGRQLIQRLVTSNPSPAYVKRVAAAFADNGAGVRGDLKAVFAAVLIDDEARAPAGLANPDFGRLREPMLRLAQWGRSFGVNSTKGTWRIGDQSNASYGLGQSPLRSPSVFNYFRPGYVPPATSIAERKLVAPEFQIVNESSVGGYLNFLQNALPYGIDNGDVRAAYTAEKALALDPAALVKRLNLLLTGNQLSSATVSLITNALATPALNASSSEGARLNRVYAAVMLVMGAPEYLVQK